MCCSSSAPSIHPSGVPVVHSNDFGILRFPCGVELWQNQIMVTTVWPRGTHPHFERGTVTVLRQRPAQLNFAAFHQRAAARLTEEAARRSSRRVAFAALLLFRVLAARFVAFRAVLFPFRRTFLALRSTPRTM